MVVIGVPVYGQLALVRRAIVAIDRHTPVEIDLIVIDDCGPERLTEAALTSWLGSKRRWQLIQHEANEGFVGSANELFQLAGTNDVVVVNSDVEVLPGWFEGLATAITSAGRVTSAGRGTGVGQVASASSLATEGGVLSLPELIDAEPSDLVRVRAEVPASVEIPVAVAHCTWFTRAALDQVGPFDRAFDPGYGEEVDWSLRSSRSGFCHLAALHSFVRHTGNASFGTRAGFWSLARRHEVRLLTRYPIRWLAIRRFVSSRDNEFAQLMRRLRQGLAT